jgi:4-amino-4-deoxy-L-arabinose transferase-like glycosyltransferase
LKNTALSKVINIAAVLAVSVLSLAVFVNSMTKPIGHDEQMYCTAAVFLAQGKMIYRDFSYVAQMPYHPLLCAAVFKIFNTTYYLLTTRILSVIFDVLTLICIFGTYRNVFRLFPVSGLLLGLAGALLYLFNPFADYTIGFAWNHNFVIFAVVLSFWILQTTDFAKESKYWRIAAVSALLTLATCMRITTVLAQFLFFIFLLAWPAESAKQKLKNILPFLIAAAVILVWPLWVIVSAPRAFYLNLYSIPVLNGYWLYKTGMFYWKSEMLIRFLTTPGSYSAILIAIYLFAAILFTRKKLTISNAEFALLAVFLTVIFFIIALIPLTIWPQYFAAPSLFLVISFAYPLLYLRQLAKDRIFSIAAVLITACVVITINSYPCVFARLSCLFSPQRWIPIQVHNTSMDIAGITKSPKLVLTLAPLYALEGRCNVYTEFSAGPFVYRVANVLSPAERQITHAAGSEMIGELIKDNPPSALIVGSEYQSLDMPLFEAVSPEPQNWEKKIYDAGPTVYFRQ